MTYLIQLLTSYLLYWNLQLIILVVKPIFKHLQAVFLVRITLFVEYQFFIVIQQQANSRYAVLYPAYLCLFRISMILINYALLTVL